MAKEITLPKLSEDADEGEVAEIMIKESDTIEKDDSIIAVSSDKATVEVPSPVAGTIKEIKVSEGDPIKTGDVIALIEEGGESKQKEEKQETEQEQEKGDADEHAEEEEQEKKSTGSGEAEPEKSAEEKKKEPAEKEGSESGVMPAAPGAKRLARKHDVDLEKVEGSGPDGLITEEDVKMTAGLSSRREVLGAERGIDLPDFSRWGTVERRALSSIRKATARQTQSSWQTIPHVTQFDEADVSSIEEYKEKHQKKAKEQGGKLTITAVLTKIIANGLHQYPKFNASIDMNNEEVILKKYIHIGVAVDTDQGLLVPIVRNVDKKSIIDLAVEIPALAEQARNGDLGSDEMEGGNFIISNLGGIGGTQFTPVVYHPQVAILGASEMKTKPVYSNETESFQPRLMLPLSLSYDHRLIDGAEGARFLRYVCNALEDPYKALLG